jgi:hypothetical protein
MQSTTDNNNSFKIYIHYKSLYCSTYKVFYVFTSHCLVMIPNNVDSSASILISLLADDCPTTNSWWQLTHSTTNFQILAMFCHHWLSLTKSQCQSNLTTRGLLPINLSWHQAPSDSQPEIFSFQLNPCGHCPYVTSSLMRRWVYLLRICLAFHTD